MHILNHRISGRRATALIALTATLAVSGCSRDDAELTEIAAGADRISAELEPGANPTPTNTPGTATTPPVDSPAAESDAGPASEPAVEISEDDAEDANDLLDNSDEQADPEPPAPQVEPPATEQPDDGPVDLDPVAQDEPTEQHPCDTLPADGSSLVVGPDPLILQDGDLTGSLFIVNCSDGDVDWTAKTKPSVSLDDDAANLLPGEFAELDFEIDSDAWEPGVVNFKIKVSEPAHNHYIDIHAFRQLVGKDFVAGGGNLSAGPGAGGCANQCIVSALLQPSFNSPSLGLDITTNTPAKIRTWVSTQAPVEVDDVPTFPGADAIDISPDGVTGHHATLSPLSAGTHYHIIVSATDEHDHTSYRTGEFTTITPVDNPGDFVLPGDPPGCSTQCVTKAQITAGTDHSVKHISLASHTAAQFQVLVSADAPDWIDGVPTFENTELWLPSGLEFVTSWETDLEDLTAATNYHIIVRAIDASDHIDYRVGQFQTDAAPTFDVTFTNLGIRVHDDGDKHSDGELRFNWRVGSDHAGSRGEKKISDGDWVGFVRPNGSFVAYDVVDWLPIIAVAGFERDPDGKVEFCATGEGTPSDNGRNDDCDVVWSAATSGFVMLDSLDDYATCAGRGFDPFYDNQRCLTLTTGDTSHGGPEFTSYIAVQVNG